MEVDSQSLDALAGWTSQLSVTAMAERDFARGSIKKPSTGATGDAREPRRGAFPPVLPLLTNSFKAQVVSNFTAASFTASHHIGK